MIDLETRTAILRLHREGHGLRRIAQSLRLSRGAVRQVVRRGQVQLPALQRDDALSAHVALIRELHQACEGNLVRVAERLRHEGVEVAYSTLTAFCRRHHIGTSEPLAAGRYVFAPGEEMQHDTSPHTVLIGGQRTPLHCASLVLCYSRMMYMQAYRRFSRFECRAFLSEALQALGGSGRQCMVDNTSVVRHHGTGKDMVPAAEMAAFSERFGFRFIAHELGDKDRSARVERNFHYAEHNFYPGRSFESLDDLNRQFRAWCDDKNRSPRRLHGDQRAVPLELFAAERSALRPLPLHIPEVYELHTRRVDVEGCISLHRNRYSVPAKLLGRRLEVRETLTRVRIFDGHRLVAEHQVLSPGLGRRQIAVEHQRPVRPHKTLPPSAQEQTLTQAAPELAQLVARLRQHHGGQALRPVRRLHRLFVDYPTDVLTEAVRCALAHDLLDLGRIERMTLQRVRGDFFRLPLCDTVE